MTNTKMEQELLLERLIAERAPIRKFLPLFPSRRETAEYFARANAALYAPCNAIGPCVSCGRTPAPMFVEYRWAARFFKGLGFGGLEFLLVFLGHIGLRMQEYIVEFATCHPICSDCQRRLRLRRWFANVLNFVGLFIVLTMGTMAVVGWSAAACFDKPTERMGFLIGASIATGTVGLGLLCLSYLRRLRVSASIRHLAHLPFYYIGSKFELSATQQRKNR